MNSQEVVCKLCDMVLVFVIGCIGVVFKPTIECFQSCTFCKECDQSISKVTKEKSVSYNRLLTLLIQINNQRLFSRALLWATARLFKKKQGGILMYSLQSTLRLLSVLRMMIHQKATFSWMCYVPYTCNKFPINFIFLIDIITA